MSLNLRNVRKKNQYIAEYKISSANSVHSRIKFFFWICLCILLLSKVETIQYYVTNNIHYTVKKYRRGALRIIPVIAVTIWWPLTIVDDYGDEDNGVVIIIIKIASFQTYKFFFQTISVYFLLMLRRQYFEGILKYI